MSIQERSAWFHLGLTVIAVTVYVAGLLVRADGRPLAQTPYVDLMLWVVGVSVVLVIGLHVAVRVALRDDATDVRDREIEGRSEQIGSSLLYLGAAVALGLAMAELPQFWVAQTIFLALAGQAVLATVARIGFYRVGVPGW